MNVMQDRTDLDVTICGDLSAVGPPETWNGLVDNSTYPNVFRRWEWISTWWKWFGKNRKLYLLRLMHGPELIGIAPLYLARTRLGGRRLAWIGDGGPTCPEYLGPIIHRDYVAPVVEAITRHFAGASWSSIAFPDVPPDDVGTNALIDALAQQYSTIRCPGEICPYFHLPESFEALLGCLSSHGRQRKRRQLRRAREELDSRLEVLCDRDTIVPVFPTMVQLSVSSKDKAGQISPFLKPEYAGFHRETCEQLSQDSLTRVYMLLFREVPVAFLYGFAYQDKFYAFQTGYDSNMEAYSPGDIVFQMVYEHLVGERMKEFDYLRGGEEYKNQFGNMRRCTVTTLIYRRAGVAYLTERLMVRGVKRCRSWMRKRVLAARNGRDHGNG